MDFIHKCFDEYRYSFISKLENVGIYGDLAEQFLLETASCIFSIIKTTSLEKTIKILLSDKPSQLLNSINVNTLATKINMSNEQVMLAMEAIAPVMSQVFTLKCSEIVAATASLAWKSTDEAIDLAGNFK